MPLGDSFRGLGIAPKILEAIDRLSFTVPTPIQHKSIPVGIEGKDIVGVAQTGTGKTLAFAIPVIQRLAQARGRCLVLVPTRELAIQVDGTFQKLAPFFGMRTAVLIGGAPIQPQIMALKKGPRILVATPGRLIDHMEQGTILLADVSILILDEADRMFDMGFAPQIEQIIKYIPRNRQTMIFSATMPSAVLRIATAHMKLPVHVEVAPSGTTVESVVQEVFIVKREAKRHLLLKLLEQYQGSVLLFSRTKIGARKIARFLREANHRAAEIHSDRTLGQRTEALEGFKVGKYRILVATDIAARGIDVTGIELVINYDLPEEAENYVHRIGRTARMGKAGRAISFATPDQGPDVRNIEKLIKASLPVLKHLEFAKESFEAASAGSSTPSHRYPLHRRPRHGHGGHGRSRRSDFGRPFHQTLHSPHHRSGGNHPHQAHP